MINYLRKQNKERLDKLNSPNFTNKTRVMVMENDIPYNLGFLDIKEVVKVGSYAMHASWTAQVIKIINPDAEIYASKIDFPAVVDYCIENNIKIINASFTCMATKDRQQALEKYHKWGGIFVAASGNNYSRSVYFPANSEHTISVAGTNVESSVSKELDVYTEGNIYVRNKEEGMFHYYNGTSSCSPVIAGCISLILAKYPNWNCEDVRKFLKDNSKQFNEYAGVFKFPDNFNKEVEEMNNPDKIIIHHSATDDSNAKNYDGIKNHHINVNGWADIGYHYVIENINGTYVTIKGRNESIAGVHCPGQNFQSIAICLVGDFRKGNPPQEQLKEVARLIKDIYARHGELPLYKHSDFRATECPAFDLKLITDLLVTKEENVTIWQEKQGLEHLENLVKKKIIDTPDFWKSKMLEPTPVWLTLSLIDRITDK